MDARANPRTERTLLILAALAVAVSAILRGFGAGLGAQAAPSLISLLLICAGWKGGFSPDAGRWLVALGAWQIMRFSGLPEELAYLAPLKLRDGAWLIAILLRATVEVRLIILALVRYNLLRSGSQGENRVKNGDDAGDIIADAG